MILAVRLLVRKGLGLHGHKATNSNHLQTLDHLIKASSKKFKLCKASKNLTSDAMQNEIIKLFCVEVTRRVIKIMQDNGFYSLIRDKGTDASN